MTIKNGLYFNIRNDRMDIRAFFHRKKTLREQKIENSRRYYQRNREAHIERMKQYNQEHPEMRKETRKRFYQNHKEEIKAYQKEYKEQKKRIVTCVGQGT